MPTLRSSLSLVVALAAALFLGLYVGNARSVHAATPEPSPIAFQITGTPAAQNLFVYDANTRNLYVNCDIASLR